MFDACLGFLRMGCLFPKEDDDDALNQTIIILGHMESGIFNILDPNKKVRWKPMT